MRLEERVKRATHVSISGSASYVNFNAYLNFCSREARNLCVYNWRHNLRVKRATYVSIIGVAGLWIPKNSWCESGFYCKVDLVQSLNHKYYHKCYHKCYHKYVYERVKRATYVSIIGSATYVSVWTREVRNLCVYNWRRNLGVWNFLRKLHFFCQLHNHWSRLQSCLCKRTTICGNLNFCLREACNLCVYNW